MSTRFFKCPICGNLIQVIQDSGSPLVCCGREMEELIPSTSDDYFAAELNSQQDNVKDAVLLKTLEKHIPIVSSSPEDGSLHVKVGSREHPMSPSHYISFIYVETEHGGQRQDLSPYNAPEADFTFTEDPPVAIYAYCNVHGLYKAEILDGEAYLLNDDDSYGFNHVPESVTRIKFSTQGIIKQIPLWYGVQFLG